MISYQTASPGAPLVEVESDTPVPKGAEVLVKTVACGVCHSDIHIHEGAFELGGGKKLEVGGEGMVLGHEIFGEVVAALGIMKPGGFADHVLVPHSRYLFDKGDVPDSLAATYACSGLTAYGALKKVGDLQDGDEIVIIGAGGVGMMAIQIARALGMDPIVVDIDDAKLAAAQELGVSRTFNSSDPQSAKEIRKSTGGAFAALDFVGAEASVNYGLGCLRKGGMLIIICLYGGALTMPIPFIPMNARIIQGSYVGTLQDMDELMAMVRDGKIAPIDISERPLSEASDALVDLKAGKVKGRQVLVNG